MDIMDHLEVEVVNTLMGSNGDITLFKPDGKHQKRNDKFGLVGVSRNWAHAIREK